MPNTPERVREYQVAPRYLAGSIYTGDPGLLPLLDAGWALSRDELGNVIVASPDHTLRVGFLPEDERGELWMISAHPHAFAPPEWLVTLDLSAPPEIVGEFTTALATAHSAEPSSVLGGSASAGLDVTDRLRASDWVMDNSEPLLLSFESPDRLVVLRRRVGHLRHEAEAAGDTERWLFEVGPPGHRWYATATSNLPDHLLQALTTAIANPVPVPRHLVRSELERLPTQAAATPIAPSPLEVARIQAATARSIAAPRPPASALAYTTATRPPMPPSFTLAGPTR
ncbi:DUF317 domain-containing protein [Kitasatospora acidiphila]|uniref:DUF317 domain-containing protein n=1 Tax=Kitasatospora acidiphila TaxID=2567942 RepID=A0A540W0Z9_9ACTN|nr:DUF317 domain-containing protein [Kitasatospora acidiphila]TQF02024.1 DUF317 domain-containing protein [Kitasatospora acidiphila]